MGRRWHTRSKYITRNKSNSWDVEGIGVILGKELIQFSLVFIASKCGRLVIVTLWLNSIFSVPCLGWI